MHTNTRSLVDTAEIFAGIDQMENASILAFDQPGCGKSDGCLSGEVSKDLELIIEWIQCLISPDVRIIIWARGMATAAAIEYVHSTFVATKSSSSIKGSKLTTVKAVILDSPFKGIGSMVSDAIDRMDTNGFAVPKSLLNICIKMVIRNLSRRLNGFNPLNVKPIELVGRCRVPAYIMSATGDDYIPCDHGKAIALGWGGPVKHSTFDGSHFGVRPKELVVNAFQFISNFLGVVSVPPVKAELSCSSCTTDVTKWINIKNDLDVKGEEDFDFMELATKSEGVDVYIKEEVTVPSSLFKHTQSPLRRSLSSGVGGFYFHSMSRSVSTTAIAQLTKHS